MDGSHLTVSEEAFDLMAKILVCSLFLLSLWLSFIGLFIGLWFILGSFLICDGVLMIAGLILSGVCVRSIWKLVRFAEEDLEKGPVKKRPRPVLPGKIR